MCCLTNDTLGGAINRVHRLIYVIGLVEVGVASEFLEEEFNLGTSYDLAHVVTLMSSLHIKTDELSVGLKKDPSFPPCGVGG